MSGNNGDHKERKQFSRGEEKLSLADLFKDQVTNIHKKKIWKIWRETSGKGNRKNVWEECDS